VKEIRLADPLATSVIPDSTQTAPTKNVFEAHPIPLGSSGTRIFAGFLSEEYLSTLKGMARADIYDKMRRQESQIKMVLSAIKNPIKAAHWNFEPADDSDKAQKQAEFLEHVLFKDLERPWRKFVSEALTMIDFGHSVFEVIHKPVIDHPRFGSYMGIKKLGFRSQRTIQRFMFDPQTQEFRSVIQMSFGDLGRIVEIPAEFLLIFSLDDEGDNMEGVSVLRPCFGPYTQKQLYIKLEAIGNEKYAVPTPIMEVPKGKENSSELDEAKLALQAYTSHEQAYLTIPEGWKLNFPTSEFDPQKLKLSIDRCDQAMVKSVIANFLELGMSNSGGSYSLSFDQSDFFLKALTYIADEVAAVVNEKLVKPLIDMKYGPQDEYPELKHAGIDDDAGKELAESLKYMSESNVIEPDDVLEDAVRTRFRLPKKSDIGRRTGKAAPVMVQGSPSGDQVAPPVQGDQGKTGAVPQPEAQPAKAAAAVPAKDNRSAALAERILLAEKAVQRQLAQGHKILKSAMQQNLQTISQDLIQQIMTKIRKLPPSERQAAVKALDIRGRGTYRSALLDLLGNMAQGALDGARSEVPKKKNVKLAGEESEGLKLGAYDNLPKKIKDKVQSQADNLVDSQIADLEKAVYFQFDHSVDSTDSDALLEKDLADSAERYMDGPSVEAAAGNTTALVVNTARNAFFFDPEVVDEIESLTFVNGDPISPICQDLAGRTFAKDDPEAQRYMPPLHHNCKSYIVPNLTASKEIDPEGLTPSSPEIAASITLKELLQMPGVQYELEEPDPVTRVHHYSLNGTPVWRTTEVYEDSSREKLLSFENVRL
jgi:hypothetical protein